MIDYNNRKFRPINSSENGEVDNDTVFEYKQVGNILSCSYTGNSIKRGNLIGLVNDDGQIDMRYHQINLNDELMTGICRSEPELLPNGKLRLHERWQWTSGDLSKGESILEEI